MEPQTINAIGGVCEVLGVALVVRDLLSINAYRGDLARLGAQVATRYRAIEAAVRKRLGRPGRSVVVHAGTAEVIGIANNVTAELTPGPLTSEPGQSTEDQLAALVTYTNRLRQFVIDEREGRKQAMAAEHERLRGELTAERERLERAIEAAREQVHELRELTTGGMRLRWESVPILLLGIVGTTWPNGIAAWWPSWLPLSALASLVILYGVVRLAWATWPRPRDGQHRAT
jgi:hypothetical protein